MSGLKDWRNNANLTAGNSKQAKLDSKYKFGNLYELIDKEALYEAWRKINKSSAADFRWKASRNGKDYILMETNTKRMTKSLKAFTDWCKENRNNRIRKIVDMVNAKLRGYFNYYGISGNSHKINRFYGLAKPRVVESSYKQMSIEDYSFA